MLILDQFSIVQNLEISPIPQTSNCSLTLSFLFLTANQLYNILHKWKWEIYSPISLCDIFYSWFYGLILISDSSATSLVAVVIRP